MLETQKELGKKFWFSLTAFLSSLALNIHLSPWFFIPMITFWLLTMYYGMVNGEPYASPPEGVWSEVKKTGRYLENEDS